MRAEDYNNIVLGIVNIAGSHLTYKEAADLIKKNEEEFRNGNNKTLCDKEKSERR